MRTVLFALLLFPFLGFSQIPEYYSSIDFSQSGENLKNQLSQLITDTHTIELIYTPEVWNALKFSDLDPENSDNILMVYGYDDTDGIPNTDRSRGKNLTCHTTSCVGRWNREHVFPRSLGVPNLGFQFAGADIHHIRPADTERNSLRSNRPFEAGSGTASYVTASGNFYPGAEWRGDVARMMMYMYLRYPTQCSPLSVGVGPATFAPLQDIPDIFLIWNAEDPVSDFEIQRNNHIQIEQGNRNPFIDNPYLATLIWTGPEAEDTWGVLHTQSQTTTPWIIYPTVTDNCVFIQNYTQNTTVTVYNSIGQRFDVNFENEKLCLEDVSSGLYFINIQSFNENQVFKIVKK